RLAQQRALQQGPLNVLIQVNLDDESQKAGCHPDEIEGLASLIEAQPQLTLRGLMAIPAPREDPKEQRAVFGRLRRLFDQLAERYPSIDTLSAGMSDDLEAAIAEGSTMVRVGTALFGPRPRPRR
ncbi:MAG: YggS family pyridoxal phosphate-dependent enzyme, partial [Wenzhouxiangella sp.]